jgi:hypothetical protein
VIVHIKGKDGLLPLTYSGVKQIRREGDILELVFSNASDGIEKIKASKIENLDTTLESDSGDA